MIMYLFSEFGRRVHDNGSGTDHGAAGVAFAIGDGVNGGIYGEYPPQPRRPGTGRPGAQLRLPRRYTTIIEDWMKMDAKPIVNGSFEKFNFVK